MHNLSHIMVVTVLMALAGCSVGVSGLDDGSYLSDGAVAPDSGPCSLGGCGAADGGQSGDAADGGALDVDAGTPGEDGGPLPDVGTPGVDAGTDAGVIVMDDAGTDAGTSPDAGLPDCLMGVYSSVTGHCYRFIDPSSLDSCASLGMESAWWSTAAEQSAVEATGLLPSLGGVVTDLYCPNYYMHATTCSRGEFGWMSHPAITPVIAWGVGSPTSGTGAGFHADGMHAFTGGGRAGGGYLCQSL